ncbi:hypothetical protein [Roseateles terrae]|uniref:Uncharacterized protein n=1 Tax=Roseateles terrae TaxID=431060 RepID=A0ABR6GTT5_9BURK|nr:hypothetical protein [Roseateles terrae]MBB3195506.1 hypothetical protein [Roseateles terrae]OWQ86426.1 hypothetical protein CDN98_11765 [Roseateles terrae]
MAIAGWTFPRPVGLIATTLLFAALATGCKPAKLNEEMVQDMIHTGLQASANRNATALCDQIADDADIRLVLFKFSGSDIRSFSKGEWCDYLRESFAKANETGMQVNINLHIQSLVLSPDGKSADVQTDVVEEVGLGGRTLARMRSKQIFTVELRKGKPLYTKLSARYTA